MMANRTGVTFSKALALSGTVLLWFPILFTLLTSAIGSIRSRAFHLDYLMPAELFPVALIGALLLVWAIFRAKSRRKSVVASAAVMAVCFGGVLLIPVATGLASGATPPEGWPWALTILSLAMYIAAMISTGVLGALLIKDLFHRAKNAL